MDAELGPNFLVIGDIHGERQLAEEALRLAENKEAAAVFLGDIINGPDTKGTIEAIRSFGGQAIAIAGNHEWVCRNALHSPDIEASADIRDLAWSNKPKLLKSYGLKQSNRAKDALNLRKAMEELGHWQWLEELLPFFETDDFVAVHSGPLLDQPWEDQGKELIRQSQTDVRLYEEPIQIIDHAHLLSGVIDIPKTVDTRMFVTGHKHLRLPVSKRTAKNRVCLASRINEGQPLFAWESQTGQIHTIKNP